MVCPSLALLPPLNDSHMLFNRILHLGRVLKCDILQLDGDLSTSHENPASDSTFNLANSALNLRTVTAFAAVHSLCFSANPLNCLLKFPIIVAHSAYALNLALCRPKHSEGLSVYLKWKSTYTPNQTNF